ncbi:MAG TPA: type II secretion system protein [Burkholderiales bacterium]|nr:type II secretion system protein [Burkholderiales bacterium]
MAGSRAQAVAAQGFTLIELVITVAIVALLASVALPVSELAVQRTKEQELRRTLRQIREAIDLRKQASDEGRIQKSVGDSGYPKKLEELAEGVDDQKTPKKEKIYFLRRIPRDPLNADPTLSAAATWGKRSYASPPDDPRDGDDVFDVFSLASGKGINGQPYRDW